MQEKFTFTKGRLIGFLCCALFPVLVIGFGILLLTKHVVFTGGFAFVYIFMPLMAAGLLAWCIFSDGTILKKGMISGAILVLFAVLSFFLFVFVGLVQAEHYEGAEAEQLYADVKADNTLMPELSAIGQPAGVEYHRVTFHHIFSSETDLLVCRYSSDEYAIQKAALDTDYAFQTEAITNRYDDCQPAVEIDGYRFRLLSTEEYEETIRYPKNVILIGYSDDAREIVYIAYENIDLDYISSLKDFVLDDCGWKYVR